MQATSTYENVHADESPLSGAAHEASVSRGTRRRRFDGEVSGEGTADILMLEPLPSDLPSVLMDGTPAVPGGHRPIRPESFAFGLQPRRRRDLAQTVGEGVAEPHTVIADRPYIQPA